MRTIAAILRVAYLGSLALQTHVLVLAFHVHRYALLLGHDFYHIDRKTHRVVQDERVLATLDKAISDLA